jgi:phosphatidylglycerol lysyltransferase
MSDADARFLAALRAYGRNATSFQLLEDDFLVWFDDQQSMDEPSGNAPSGNAPSVDSGVVRAAVAYVDTGAAWVAGGEPLAPEADVPVVASRFLAAARRAGRRAAFFATEGQLADAAGFRRLQLGEQPIWDPAAWDATVTESRSLRAQIRRAGNKQVTVREVTVDAIGQGTTLRTALDRLVERWQATRAMASMGFLVRVTPFAAASERLVFVAEREGKPVGLLSMAPVYARNGWLFEDLLRDPSAPNGTSELLVDAGMRRIAEDGCRWATLGLAPLAGPVRPWLVRVRTIASPFFNFRGLQAFKAKLHPDRWEPIWLAYPAGSSGWRALLDALTAFAGGSLVRFGWRTLRRGPRPVLLAMTLLLIPWTAVLAVLPADRWFPAPWMQDAWVTFDAALFVGLSALVVRWRDWLGTALASAVTADASLTGWQAVTWYAPRVEGVLDVLLMAMACAGPLAAAMVLWGTVGRYRVLR